MFTLRFYEHESMDCVVVCGEKYTKNWRDGWISVVVYDKTDSGEGTEFKITHNSNCTKNSTIISTYGHAYVENGSGKTIDRVGPIEIANE